jgi:hypothetical protein
MAAILYLDVDDEITSAVARMKDQSETRIALVVPPGSRLGTSRINFRLLAREAQGLGRTLAIVAPDAATRALAGSAGLDTFAAVGEYEASAVAGGPAPAADVAAGDPAAIAAPSTRRPRRARRRPAAVDPAPGPDDATAATVAMPIPAPWVDPPGEPVVVPPARVAGWNGQPMPPPAAEAPAAPARAPSLPVVRGLSRRLPAIPADRTPMLIGGAIVALALLVTGVAAFLLLPTAEITLTPRVEVISPVAMTITADPDTTAPDVGRGFVPADRLSFDLSASESFPSTGKRVEADPAVGEVTFENYDPTERNVVPAGSVVSTEGGIKFRTTAAVSVPAGTFVLPEVVPGTATIGIQADRAGPAGNVPANAITVVPARENPIFLRVRNAEPTTGGARREFLRVAQVDIDAALVRLETMIGEQFDAILADPASVPEGATLFPETRQVSLPAPTVDPATLLGQETDTFELAMTATGSVLAVDPAQVKAVAGAKIQENVAADHELVQGSVGIQVGDPQALGEQISFPVTVRASQVRTIDEAAIRAALRGMPLPDARSYLENLGEVTIEAWPDWVSSVPTLDARLNLVIVLPVAPSSSPSSSPSG